MSKPILCLDFDGVLHSYSSGWKGADIIPDPPVPGAMEFIHQAELNFTVAIFSSRSHQPGGIAAMRTWLGAHLFEFYRDAADFGLSPRHYVEDLLSKIKFPLEKPPAMVTIDDRAITFTGQWPTMETLHNFKPWNKK